MTKGELIKTKEQFFGRKVYIESTGDETVDKALLTVFHDDYRNTAPLEMIREDVQLLLSWSRCGDIKAKPQDPEGLFKDM